MCLLPHFSTFSQLNSIPLKPSSLGSPVTSTLLIYVNFSAFSETQTFQHLKKLCSPPPDNLYLAHSNGDTDFLPSSCCCCFLGTFIFSSSVHWWLDGAFQGFILGFSIVHFHTQLQPEIFPPLQWLRLSDDFLSINLYILGFKLKYLNIYKTCPFNGLQTPQTRHTQIWLHFLPLLYPKSSPPQMFPYWMDNNTCRQPIAIARNLVMLL